MHLESVFMSWLNMALHFVEIYFNVMIVWKAHQIVVTSVSFTDLGKVNYPDLCPILCSACETKHCWLINLDFSYRRQVIGCCCSVAQSCLTLCDPMDWSIPCPSPSPRVCSNSSPLSQWCHSTISSSVIPFSSCLQSSPASGPFSLSQFFTSGEPKCSSFSFKISPSNEYSSDFL